MTGGQWIACWNKTADYGLLFKAPAKTVAHIAADTKHLGAKVGMTGVLFLGSALTHHLHIHMTVRMVAVHREGNRALTALWSICDGRVFGAVSAVL